MPCSARQRRLHAGHRLARRAQRPLTTTTPPARDPPMPPLLRSAAPVHTRAIMSERPFYSWQEKRNASMVREETTVLIANHAFSRFCLHAYRWFKQMGDDYHSEDAFKFRRGQTPKFRPFWHTRAVIGHGAARAVAQRAKVAGHTLRRPRAAPNVRDALLFPATVPSVV